MNLISTPKNSSVCTKTKELLQRFGIEEGGDLLDFIFVKEKIQKIPYLFCKENKVLPLEEQNDFFLVAIGDINHLEVIHPLKSFLKKKIKLLYVSEEILENGLQECYKNHADATECIENIESESKGLDDKNDGIYDLLEKSSSSPVIRILDMILVEALQQGASDLHFEPDHQALVVRYRIDGVLHIRHRLGKEIMPQILTRLKVMSKLDIAEQRLPQDGRIKLMMGKKEIDFRVSTVPTSYGERAVLRILDKGNILVGLTQIGMRQETLKFFEKQLQASQGIVLVTGPTGSGKTTTLYSAIQYLASSETNIMTIEDPVEYKLQGMAQIGVNPKINLTFATGLRHILRQDPDIIMIGEIRDKETAEIAIQASLTGHLVLSTLHTNDAPSALTRLVDMGIESYLLTSSVVAILAQRLVRVCCEACKKPYIPSPQELDDLGIAHSDLMSGVLYKSIGCSECYGSGYKGRCGIYEFLEMSHPIKNQLLKSADSTALQKIAVKEGMSTLRAEGARLALLGKTTAAEVLRVTKQILVED